MLEHQDRITAVMQQNGFQEVQSDQSKTAGNFYSIYMKETLGIRVIQDSERGAIEIRDFKDEEDWFDLAIVKAWLLDDGDLLAELNAAEYVEFLTSRFDDIIAAFSPERYPETKAALLDLYDQKYMMMFPDDDDDDDEDFS